MLKNTVVVERFDLVVVCRTCLNSAQRDLSLLEGRRKIFQSVRAEAQRKYGRISIKRSSIESPSEVTSYRQRAE